MSKKNLICALGLSTFLISCQFNPVSNSNNNIHLPEYQLVPGSKGGLVPGSKGEGLVPGSKGITGGGIGIQFDLGQALSPADFIRVDTDAFTIPPLGFHIQQESGTPFTLTDIASATVTVISSQVEKPAVATLSRQDIADGWSFLFEDIPAGIVAVVLDVHNQDGQRLFSKRQTVDVVAGNVTPVHFTLELAGELGTCPIQCTGSIKVSVDVVTPCYGRVRITPLITKINETVTVQLADIQGKVEHFDIRFGDGTPLQNVRSLPVVHQYTQIGRYPVDVTLSGSACKAPYTARAFVSVGDRL